ncbi:hypothetical protein [Streptomyces sp. SHP 1-2]|uniref:hypothetical protein n=1 Tax=Streptomyces sp. SHP 1-2 TaxID=2769489 RepID=UPI002238CB85|nr:hypothetical protein [Streptomyces sp. SHP 1-2]MCW5254714.1 hypothetical protein [Streptomyces sp. SHP 1-2]
MARKRDTGKGAEYSDAEAGEFAQNIGSAYAGWAGSGEPSRVDVRAQVEWAGHVMPGNNGMRRTRIDLPADKMREVRKAVEKAQKAAGVQATAKPAASYRAKGWEAQFRQLFRTGKGYQAMSKAGVTATSQTLSRWLRGEQSPNKANREAIARAYDEMRGRPVTEARDAAAAAAREAAKAMTEAMHSQYGVNIRFRDIEQMWFE